MQMINARENKSGLVFLLIIIFAGVVSFTIVVPTSESTFLGSCLVAVGAFNILLHRVFGRQTFEWMRRQPAFVASFWTRTGQKGTQLLYLWMGIILASAGSFLLIKSGGWHSL